MPSRTVGKRELKEARATLAQTRYTLKRNILDIEAERRAIQQERADSLRALVRLTKRLGISGLDFDTPLANLIDTLTDHLAQQTTSPAVPPAPPSPLSPTTIESDGRTYRAACGCGWRSSLTPREQDAVFAAMKHEERLHATA